MYICVYTSVYVNMHLHTYIYICAHTHTHKISATSLSQNLHPKNKIKFA